MKLTKPKIVSLALIILLILSFFFLPLYQKEKQISNSFTSEKVSAPYNLNFIAKIEGKPKLESDCFAFFISNKYSVTTDICAHESMATLKKLDRTIEGNDYIEVEKNGLLLKSVIRAENKLSKFSIISTEKFISQFVNVSFSYNENSSDVHYMPVVIDDKYVYLYTVSLKNNIIILNNKGFPENCEILAGTPVFIQNSKGDVGIKAMVLNNHLCGKKNTLPIIKSTDFGGEIDKITNCISFYMNIPGQIDNIGKCSFSHYP
jgi:hypothetical protein